MKRVISCILCATLWIGMLYSQSVNLNNRFQQVQFHPECGGWYFLSEQKGGETLYGIADNNGNVIASEARKYKLHKGYIELYLIDNQKKQAHDQWIADMKQYEIDMNNYQSIKTRYEAEVKAYNAKVDAAKAEATNRFNAERARVERQARAQVAAEQRKRAAQTQNSGWLGALAGGLGAVSDALAVTNAVNAVKFEPFFDQVKGERGLVVGPSKPYNPMPTKPTEPESGFYWASYALRQPNNYTYIDFEKIKDGEGFADVKSVDGKWGLVDASISEVIPCENSSKVFAEWVNDSECMVKTNTGYGILSANNLWVIQPQYSSLKKLSQKGYIAKSRGMEGVIDRKGTIKIPFVNSEIKSKDGLLYCKQGDLWGIYTQTAEELYPCQFQNIELNKLNEQSYLFTQDKGQWGAINFSSGRVVLSNQYSKIEKITVEGPTKKDYFKVLKNNKIGLIDDNGAVILPVKFDNLTVDKGMFIVKSGLNEGLYSSTGIELIPHDRYTKFLGSSINIKGTNVPIFYVYKNKQIGVCDTFGKELIAPDKYTELTWNEKLMAFIARNEYNRYGIISLSGEEILPFCTFQKPNYSIYHPNFITYGVDYGAYAFNGQEIASFKKYNGKNTEKMEKIFAKMDKKSNMALSKAANEKKEIINNSIANVINAIQIEATRRNTFSFYAQNYVERIINDWQQRGEFEKIDAWKLRVNEKTRSQKIYELTGAAQKSYISLHQAQLPNDSPYIVGAYDPDNETYLIKTNYSSSDILVHVPSIDAQEFKANFSDLKRTPTFFVENDGLALSEYQFTMPNGTKYTYSNQASLTHTIANVEYNFNPVEIDGGLANKNFKGGKQTVNTKNLRFGTSDIDVGIPQNSETYTNTFAVIIANENYQQEEAVDFAFNDGSTFRQYCIKALGIPENNIHFRPDATLNDMRFEFNWMKQMADAYEGKAKFIVYYAGHGMPDARTKDAYLLPIDGYSSDVTSGYRLSDVYNTLGELPSENVLAFVDACFSGTQRDGHSMSKGDRGVAITPDIKTPQGNLVVFSAASGNETAHAYSEKQHGMFTYYLMKKLKEHEGPLTFGDLASYVTKEVKITTLREKNLAQTPNVTHGAKISSEWENIIIK